MTTQLGTLEELPADYRQSMEGERVSPLWPMMRNVLPHDRPNPVTLTIGLGTEFYMSIESESDAAVFRWRLTPKTTY